MTYFIQDKTTPKNIADMKEHNMNNLFISFRIMLYLPHPQLKMPQWQWVRIWNLQQGDKLFVEVLLLTVGKYWVFYCSCQ